MMLIFSGNLTGQPVVLLPFSLSSTVNKTLTAEDAQLYFFHNICSDFALSYLRRHKASSTCNKTVGYE